MRMLLSSKNSVKVVRNKVLVQIRTIQELPSYVLLIIWLLKMTTDVCKYVCN